MNTCVVVMWGYNESKTLSSQTVSKVLVQQSIVRSPSAKFNITAMQFGITKLPSHVRIEYSTTWTLQPGNCLNCRTIDCSGKSYI